jgi:hypothetical protein
MAAATVNDYISNLPPEQRTIAEALRGLIFAAAPDAKESIKWSQPVYESAGPCCWIMAHKAHVTLGFWRGMQLQSGRGVLEGSGTKMGHMKLRSTGDVRSAAIKKLVREAVVLNREKGDPTQSP